MSGETGLNIHFEGAWSAEAKEQIERAIRESAGTPPDGENWSISIDRPSFSFYCEVHAKTPRQSRTRLFFEEDSALPKTISDWLKSYPLR